MQTKINFSGRSIAYTEEEIAAVTDVMRNAPTLTQGQHMAEFESRFAAYQNTPSGSCHATMNGCAALEMSAQLCRFKPGDEVVLPSHTFTASAYPYIKHGAKPVWADIDLQTRVITADSIERVLSLKTRAVVVVHLYGYVADMQEIRDLCASHGILCIEDAAQAIGSTLAGQKAGSFGDMGIFSFHSHKNLTTLGEGGMLYVRDPELAALVPMLRHNGHCAYDFERSDYWKPAMGNVDLPMLGDDILMPSNYCLGEAECALGVMLLKRIDEINSQKRERAIKFIDSLGDCDQLEFHRENSPRHNYHLLAARMITGPEARDRFIRHMNDKFGVRCVVQYIPLDRYDFYKKLGFGKSRCPNADKFFDSMISFPFQHTLTDEELDYMSDATRKTIAAIS